MRCVWIWVNIIIVYVLSLSCYVLIYIQLIALSQLLVFTKCKELSAKEQRLYCGSRGACNKFVRKGGKGPYVARSGTEGETGVPLIEKAYVKIHSDYESLERGWSPEAVEGYVVRVSSLYKATSMFRGVSMMYRDKV